MTRLLLIALLATGCSHEEMSDPIDAGPDGPGTLALTVEGPPAVQPTRTLKVTITSAGYTHSNSFAVTGIPATVEIAQPIQLTTWSILVDGFDMNGRRIGHGAKDVPAGTTETTVTLAPPM